MSVVAAMPVATGPGPLPAGQATPSTDGFLQTLDQFLSTTDTQAVASGNASLSTLFGMDTFSVSSAFGALNASVAETDKAAAEGTDLSGNPALCQQLAGILQALGFQVRAEDIAELSALDAKQLDSALEFVERNLERGLDTSEIAECTALLLPRAWPLDDLDGAPLSAGQASGTTGAGKLPEGFQASVETARGELAKATSGTASEPSPQDRKSGGSDNRNSPSGQENFLAWTRPQDTLQPSSSPETQEAKSGRHLAPGGMASELIGRQVLERVHVQLAEGRRELSLRLWPEELGEVRLSLRMNDGNGIQANMVVENDSVRQAMLDSMPQLRDALSRHGLDLEKMTVSVGSGNSAMAGSGSETDRKRGDGNPEGRHGNGSRQAQMEVATPLQLGRDTGHRNGRNSFEIWS
ncbi:MAG TPA: flagellar hook-length control protein FliK [Fibrobacteria bacterium]|nr:flagellar hook-length control protein FliK [Fibrobacteria bacterium]HOX50248.1 flagellar hook-length control protein FliK [Fibrobacteria bacterium]